MKARKIFIGILVLSISLFISACTNENPRNNVNNQDNNNLEEEIKEKNTKIEELEKRIKELEKSIEETEVNNNNDDDEYLLNNLINVVKTLKEEDLQKLKPYIHPEKGVRFSPYPHVDLEKDIILKNNEIENKFNDSKIYIWGDYDGKGDPIELNFSEYYKEFVYDEDFLNPHIIGINTIVSSGNSIDNVKEAYPEGQFVELYFKGFDEQYEGIDWKSLKLVFEKYEGKWFLVGIIHGQWTI